MSADKTAYTKSCLELVNKIIIDNKELYTFEVNGKTSQLSLQQAIQLIQNYAPPFRNCQTDGKKISRKAGCGELPVIDKRNKVGQKRKNIPDMYSLLLHTSSNPSGINIFTGKKYRDLCTIFSNDIEFTNIIPEKEFLKRHADTIQEIDNAVIVNYEMHKTETPFGVCAVSDLSTGLKTVLNILYLKEYGDKDKFYMVNIDECGDNILENIYKTVNNTNIALYLNHSVKVFPENGYNFYVNCKKVKDGYDAFRIILKEAEK